MNTIISKTIKLGEAFHAAFLNKKTFKQKSISKFLSGVHTNDRMRQGKLDTTAQGKLHGNGVWPCF